MRNQHHLKWLFGSAVLFFIIPVAIAQRTVTVPEEVVSYADLVVYNGKVVTMDDRSINPLRARWRKPWQSEMERFCRRQQSGSRAIRRT